MGHQNIWASAIESEGALMDDDWFDDENIINMHKAPPVKNDSYTIITYPAKELPAQFKALVFSKWLHSLRHGNDLFKKVAQDEYYKVYHVFIENLLAKPDAIIRLAVLSDDHDVVLGFSVSREDVLDYVHVHKDQRRLGIGTRLIPEKTTTFSHLTKTWITIWQRKYRDLQFNPFA